MGEPGVLRTGRYLRRAGVLAAAVSLAVLSPPAAAAARPLTTPGAWSVVAASPPPRIVTTGPFVNPAQGTPGPCTSSTGVTVVVDLQDLPPGTIVVRCYEGNGTGYDALLGAGFQLEGTRHDGPGFVCRIAGRPSATESISIPGDPDYRESCGPTPPASAYWSYWHAPNGGSWTYSQRGVMNRRVIPGGWEGWSFSRNRSANTNPQPRVRPSRAIAAAARPRPAPGAGAPAQGAPGQGVPPPGLPAAAPGAGVSGAEAPGTPGQGAPATPGGVPIPAPGGASGAVPSAPVTAPAASGPPLPAPRTGSLPRQAPEPGRVTGLDGREIAVATEVPVPPAEEKGTAVAPWIASGLVAVLAGLGGFTAWRRKHRR